MSSKREFASKIGLVAATVGSAIGLGNVWRFPAETQANGGAAFLLLYIVCVLCLGVPVMLAEFSLGRAGRSDAIGAFRNLSPGKPWWIVGAVAVLASYLIICYYMVVAGWTLEYFWQSVTGGLFEGLPQGEGAQFRGFFSGKMEKYIATDTAPLIFTFLMIIINIGVLLGGVQKGIERLSNIMMPLLFVILVAMCVLSLTLPGASEGVSYFLNPDFSKINASVVVNALGQAFFSLSLGMGILVTYASYYPADTKLGKTALTVSLLSVGVAVLMGLVIFPAVKSFGLDGETLRGATLVFVTLPEVFAQLPLPQLWAALFFFLLLVAALTSTVSIAEVSIAMFQDRLHMSRRTATFTVMLPLFVLSALCSLSMGSFSKYTVLGMNFFDLLDSFTTNCLLPVVALGTCVYMGWFAPRGLLCKELTNGASIDKADTQTRTVLFIIRYISPVLIVAIVAFSL